VDAARIAEMGPRTHLGVVNVYRRMRGLGLWQFVGREDDSTLGNVHFRCTSVPALLAATRALGFTAPRSQSGFWQVRQRVAHLALHLKHFDGWPDDKLQAHIDPIGVGGPLVWIRHVLDWGGYRDVERIARMIDAP
jgi:hypothetical protein